MPEFFLRNGRDYICKASSLPEHNALIPVDLVDRKGEVVKRGRYQLRRHVDKMLGREQVPVFLLADQWGDVPVGSMTLVAVEDES